MKKAVFVLVIMFMILFQLFFPWWSMVFPCIAAGYFIPLNRFRAFMLGFIIVFSVWTCYSFYINITQPGIISERAASLLSLPNKYMLFSVSGITGGIVGGVSVLLGFLWKEYQETKGDQI